MTLRPRRLLVCWQWLAGWIERLTPLFVLIGVLVLAGLVIRSIDQQHQIQDSRHSACLKANERHRKAIPQLGRLITQGRPPRTDAEREQRRASQVALHLLEEGAPQPEKGDAPESVRYAYIEIVGFIEIIAPHYDCTKT